MKMIIFAKRNLKEMLRDPISLAFGIGLPVVLLVVMSLINKSIDESINIFEIDRLAPGLAVFSLSFIILFSGLLIASDRCQSFIIRLYASPLKPIDFILGYTLPLIPIALMQGTICFVVALFLGLEFSLNILLAILLMLPGALLFISMGLLFGVLFNDKAVSGVSSIFVQVAALSSGIWFPLEIMVKSFTNFCYALPFAPAVDIVKMALTNDFSKLGIRLLVILIYTIVIYFVAVLIFKKKMKA